MRRLGVLLKNLAKLYYKEKGLLKNYMKLNCKGKDHPSSEKKTNYLTRSLCGIILFLYICIFNQSTNLFQILQEIKITFDLYF